MEVYTISDRLQEREARGGLNGVTVENSVARNSKKTW
jgi:hypothetical protein